MRRVIYSDPCDGEREKGREKEVGTKNIYKERVKEEMYIF